MLGQQKEQGSSQFSFPEKAFMIQLLLKEENKNDAEKIPTAEVHTSFCLAQICCRYHSLTILKDIINLLFHGLRLQPQFLRT